MKMQKMNKKSNYVVWPALSSKFLKMARCPKSLAKDAKWVRFVNRLVFIFFEHCDAMNTRILLGKLVNAQSLTPKQSELLQLLGEYRDVLYTEAAGDAQQRLVRAAYCLHVLDHVMRSRQRVLRHNARAKKSRTASSSSSSECRDQGLVRPRVLILAPFRSCAVKSVGRWISSF